MPTTDEPNRPIKSVETALAVVEELKRRERAGVSELAEALEMSVGAVHGHLNTLEHQGYLVKEEGTYRLATAFLDLGHAARSAHTIHGEVAPALDEIAEQTGYVTCFATIEHMWGVYIDVAYTDPSVRFRAHPGYQYEPHMTASGKSMLSQLPEPRAREIVEHHEFQARTENTITDYDALQAEFEEIRSTGHAISTGERTVGRTGIAAPIVFDGDVYGAIAIAGPAIESVSGQLDDMANLVKTQVSSVELKLQKAVREAPDGVNPVADRAIN